MLADTSHVNIRNSIYLSALAARITMLAQRKAVTLVAILQHY